MKTSFTYFDFIKEKGRPLTEINPGSDELALTVEDALDGLRLLQDSKKAILGGDIFSQRDDKLIYAYKLWGEQYIYLNWYCDKMDNESQSDYLLRSYTTAKDSVIRAYEIAKKLKHDCYVVFVIEG